MRETGTILRKWICLERRQTSQVAYYCFDLGARGVCLIKLYALVKVFEGAWNFLFPTTLCEIVVLVLLWTNVQLVFMFFFLR
jgi:hypothetical protein